MKKSIYKFIKRALDIIFSATLLTLLALPMLLIAVAIRIDTPGGALFKQIRVGRNGELFVCRKFRTMYTSAPPCMPTRSFSKCERYITRVGRFLRNSSLDELPQLFNVLKGDMSLVGPRPLILAESQIHRGRRESGVYTLRPGITGLAQVSGRDNVCDEEKLRLDTEYLSHFGIVEDVKILGKTFTTVLFPHKYTAN